MHAEHYICLILVGSALLQLILAQNSTGRIIQLSEKKIRLSGGTTDRDGRVEVLYNGEWGTVCQNGWDDADARVVCRMLGYDFGRASYCCSSHGPGSGQIWLSNVDCTNNDNILWNCYHDGWGTNQCSHYNDAGVWCSYKDETLRLVGGSDEHEGRLEVFHNNQWGTVCDDDWTIVDATVACKMLGYDCEIISSFGEATCCGQFGIGTGPIWLDDLRCTSEDVILWECAHSGWGNHNCQHVEDAGVICYFTTNKMRLVNGSGTHDGRVEVYNNQQWGTVCDVGWDNSDATTTCRMMGYEQGEASCCGSFGQGTGPVWLSNMSCTVNDPTLWDCTHPGWGNNNCAHDQDAGVSCFYKDNQIRLADGYNKSEGRVEVYHDRQWGTICDDRWEDRDATIVCKMLGYDYGEAECCALYGQGSGPIWLDEVSCNDDDTVLWQCSHPGWGVHNCDHRADAGVKCYYTDQGIRLANGWDTSNGRVEVFHDGIWGTVCDDSFGTTEATVVCQMLGYDIGYESCCAYFGYGYGPIWLDDINCNNDSTILWECSHNGWGIENCGHSEDVGVWCYYSHERLRLLGGHADGEGRVEVYHPSYGWGTVCDDFWDNTAASVVCKMLGYDLGFAHCCAEYGQGSGSILLDNVRCSIEDENLWDCVHNGWGNTDCSHAEDAGVSCFYREAVIQLAGGSTQREGRVEVFHDNKWGTVCDRGWTDDEAFVVCKSLGYDYGGARCCSDFGGGTGPVWLDNVKCTVSDVFLWDCSHNGWGNTNCIHDRDAGVNCYYTEEVLRLVGGPGAHSGRVELFHEGQWGTVCDDEWDDTDATVVCKMMGYDYGVAYCNAYFGEGTGPIWLDSVDCGENDTIIWKCKHDGWGVTDCLHSEDAGAQCFYNDNFQGKPESDNNNIEAVDIKSPKTCFKTDQNDTETQGFCKTTDVCCRKSACIDGDLVADATSCSNYYKCKNGEWLKNSCPDGVHFDCFNGCTLKKASCFEQKCNKLCP